jgi:hypothetical protein
VAAASRPAHAQISASRSPRLASSTSMSNTCSRIVVPSRIATAQARDAPDRTVMYRSRGGTVCDGTGSGEQLTKRRRGTGPRRGNGSALRPGVRADLGRRQPSARSRRTVDLGRPLHCRYAPDRTRHFLRRRWFCGTVDQAAPGGGSVLRPGGVRADSGRRLPSRRFRGAVGLDLGRPLQRRHAPGRTRRFLRRRWFRGTVDLRPARGRPDPRRPRPSLGLGGTGPRTRPSARSSGSGSGECSPI